MSLSAIGTDKKTAPAAVHLVIVPGHRKARPAAARDQAHFKPGVSRLRRPFYWPFLAFRPGGVLRLTGPATHFPPRPSSSSSACSTATSSFRSRSDLGVTLDELVVGDELDRLFQVQRLERHQADGLIGGRCAHVGQSSFPAPRSRRGRCRASSRRRSCLRRRLRPDRRTESPRSCRPHSA